GILDQSHIILVYTLRALFGPVYTRACSDEFKWPTKVWTEMVVSAIPATDQSEHLLSIPRPRIRIALIRQHGVGF
ncbi:MAG: hypothetical protein KUF72_08875, partial [Candidatus Thiodiazotropha sp. (ex Ctena orbiculata)]|nr:hypothetical protein [Candidatus Thiodiazotropha taylori]